MSLFEKGDPRINRRGRPRKGKSLTEALNQRLDEPDASGKTRKTLIAEKLVELALTGDVPALRYIFDRLDGRPRQTVNIDVATENRLLEVLK
jgi:hypothetical protein